MAGILFGLLFGATLILIRLKMPEGVGDSAEWLDSQKGGISTATKLMPFAGITFLWFIGVVRDNLGRYEDRFFASVLLGSGLLFLAMMFVSTAVAAALVATNAGVTDSALAAEPFAVEAQPPGRGRRCASLWTGSVDARPNRCRDDEHLADSGSQHNH